MNPIIIHTVSAASWPQIVTAIASGSALLLSIVALSFQFASWRRAGFRPRLSTSRESRSTGTEFVVTVRNVGRVAGSVESVMFIAIFGGRLQRAWDLVRRRKPGLRIVPTRDTTDLNDRLEPNAALHYRFRTVHLEENLQQGGYSKLIPEVTFGSGRVVVTDEFQVSLKYRQLMKTAKKLQKASKKRAN